MKLFFLEHLFRSILRTCLQALQVSCCFDKFQFTLEAIDPKAPLVLYQLLPHEQKMSIVNMVIRKHPTCTVPIVGKQKLIFYVGFRKFEAEPIFSQHTNGDKFKVKIWLFLNYFLSSWSASYRLTLLV